MTVARSTERVNPASIAASSTAGANARRSKLAAAVEPPIRPGPSTSTVAMGGRGIDGCITLVNSNLRLDVAPALGGGITRFDWRHDGALVPMDRGGNPSFNPILNADDIKDEFNSTDPVDDVKNYVQPLSEALQRHGYSSGEATAAARTLLPDILLYDRFRRAHYPNGRVMTDDVFSARMIFMTHGRANPQGVRPHDDLLPQFPHLGPPNP
jgi:hypothetical protein